MSFADRRIRTPTRTVVRIAVGGIVAATLLGGFAEVAPAKKVKRTVPLHMTEITENDGTHTSYDLKYRSREARCLNLKKNRPLTITLWVTFASGEDGLYPDPSAVWTDGMPKSKPFPIQKVGPGHFRWEVPNSLRFTTTNPGGSYGGTYPISHWWFGLWHTNFMNGIFSWTDVNYPNIPSWKDTKNKVRFRKNGVLHVIRCLIPDVKPSDYFTTPKWPDRPPNDQGTPVPGSFGARS